jgi:photosystem II stability/assembly factor-like uncharacterized protein
MNTKFCLLAVLLLTSFAVEGTPVSDNSFLSAVEWRFVGPYRGGRVIAVAGVPGDPLVYYFGSAHGGVWKTTDAGLNWRNVSDHYIDFPAVGALDVSPSDPNVIFVGTGEGLQRQYISPGNGVYKSTDGGDTWINVGLSETRHIAKVRIHPNNPNIVYVAAMGNMFGPNPDRGVFRTVDGGKTWKKILYAGETAGAVDLTIDPAHPNILFAALNHHVTYPWNEESGGPSTGLFKTEDGGDTWTDITSHPGLPQGLIGKIGISISAARPNRVYAIIEANKGGVYRSDDGGSTWQMTYTDPRKLEIPNSYNHITADPRDPDSVYIQVLDEPGFWKSTDGGRTFEKQPTQNWDHHALWIDPHDSRRMIDGGDGGAAVTSNGGKSWSSLENQPTADLLSLAVDDQQPYWIYGAQNDNSHIAIPSRVDGETIGWQDYRPLPGGEGGQTAVKPDGSVVYMCDRANLSRFDTRTGQTSDISVWPEAVYGARNRDVKYRFYYTCPVLLSPHNSGVLYTAAQYLFRSTDEGYSWDKISPDLTRNRQDVMGSISGGPISSNASSLFYVSLIRTIAESPLQPGELWVGTDDSSIHVSRDGGKGWRDISPPELPEWTTITAIEVSSHRRGTAYISGERHRVGDRTPYLYKTTDYGNTWRRISNGLKKDDYSWVIREDPIRPGLLFAGTETGAYVSLDAGESWRPLQGNLPPAIVMNMAIKGNDLVVATHGRGFWILDNFSFLRQITPEVASAPVHLFEVVPTIRVRKASASKISPESEVTAKNPPSGVMIDYYLAEAPKGDVTLTISDANGTMVRTFSSRSQEGPSPTTNSGMNRFLWDLQYSNVELPVVAGALGVSDADRWFPAAPVAPPGRYVVRLTVDGLDYERPFEIRIDPRVKASAADLQAQFELMVSIQKRLSEAIDIVMKIRDVRTQLESRRTDMQEGPRLAADRVLEQLREIEGSLMRWMGSPSHPMMWDAPGLIDKLSRLSQAAAENAKPTKSMYQLFEDLSGRLKVQRNRLNRVIDDEVAPLLSP